MTTHSEDRHRWQALGPHRTELAGPLTGWRFWHAGGRALDGHPHQPEHGRWIPAVLVDPLLDTSSEHTAITVCSTSLPPARCRREQHQAPADGCTCGYRIVRHLPELAEYLRVLHRASAPYEEDIPVAMVKVQGTGAARHGADFDAPLKVELPAGAPPEPYGTARVERMSIVGPIHLAPGIEHAAPAFERQFGVPVIGWTGGNIWGWYEALIAGKGGD